MTDDRLTLDPTPRVLDYQQRFRRFLDTEVAPLERDLASTNVGTPSLTPRLR